MKSRVIGGTLRDLTYILANLRQQDRIELDCQFNTWTPAEVALISMQGFAYVVELDGNPEAAFGACEVRSGLWTAWSWGSKRMHRCVPRMTRFFYDVLGPDVAAQGAWRVEARPLAGNHLAERWLQRLGANRRCDLPGYGKNGEDFALWDWTRESWNDVLCKTPGSPAPAADADDR